MGFWKILNWAMLFTTTLVAVMGLAMFFIDDGITALVLGIGAWIVNFITWGLAIAAIKSQ